MDLANAGAVSPHLPPVLPPPPLSLQDPSLRYAFRVVSPEKEYVLQAENEVEQREWMQMLQVGRPRMVGQQILCCAEVCDDAKAGGAGGAQVLHPSCSSRFCCTSTGVLPGASGGRSAEGLHGWPLPQGVIACLLSGAVAPDAIPTRPVRPTHSRT
jgi:hypothetical protein